MPAVREARESDVAAVRDLFALAYGADYPFPGFYDTAWLTKAVYDDDTLFLVAEEEGKIVATGSAILSVGGLSDLVGEIGRLVAAPTRKAQGAALAVVREILERIRDRVQFAFAEVRTVHAGAQRLAEAVAWAPAGYEPLKYRFARRESVIFYCQIAPTALELRKNNPRVIPEAAALAQTVLRSAGLPADVIVEDESEGYPTGHPFTIERLQQRGATSLLRIERGRVRQREVFGHFSLAHGFFRIADSNSHYLVARDGAAMLGAIGFTHDPIDRRVRLFELIEFDDAVKGWLLASVDRIAREELNAEYLEVDVSAYSPRIQRTLERLGFVPVAYCPAMVFQDVERLDVIRMAKLCARYDLGHLRLLEGPAAVRTLVEKGMEDRFLGLEITEATRRVEIFDGLPDGDLYHLARIARVAEHPAGAVLIREGEPTDKLYILEAGEAEARVGGRVVGRIGAGSIFGEMGLVEQTKRSADVVLTAPTRAIEIEIPRLERLLESHPRLGHVVLKNIARSLSRKLRVR